MTRLRSLRPATLAGLIVVWSVAWSAPTGLMTWDTKYEILADPLGLLRRALHLWDPQVTWGGLSNQGYGYLFPMGPFFALGSEFLPVWVVQRLWWMLLLTLGFVGALGLFRELRIGSHQAGVVGALAWVLAPKVVTSVSVLSAEIQPQLLVPLIMWPVVRGWRGRMSAPRASALSGLAILMCGGVNATATLLALVPTGLFLITRSQWWRQRLTWMWLTSAMLGTAWWFGPLVLMSRYAPPFLDWIETAKAVSAPITLLDVLRGTTHWLGHLLTPGGAWWPAGYQLATSGILIVLTAAVAALGLGGLALPSLRHRGYWWLLLAVGILALSLPHTGPLASPAEGLSQSLLDGALSPFRNIHKADAMVRLPLTIGLVHLLGVLPEWGLRSSAGPFGRLRSSAAGVGAVLVVLAAAPAFTGASVARGGHEEPADHWVQVGQWLAEQGDGASVIVPAASFGEYTWGRTIDEPLRSLTSAPYAVRDAVPLTPAGAIRLLDELELRLQTGRSIAGAPEVLRRAGIRYLVLRNDLATGASGQPPVALARSAIRHTPGVGLAKGFGRTFQDISGQRVQPVEIYRMDGDVAGSFTLHRAEDLIRSNGSSDDLHALADAGLGNRTVLFDGDPRSELSGQPRVLTDGLRARNRYFGAPRGEDASTTLTRSALPGTRDYRPWHDDSHLSVMGYEGLTEISASSSLADDLTFAGLAPAMRPFAAVDGDASTGWLTMWDADPTLTLRLAEPRRIDHLTISPFTASALVPGRLDVATRVSVTTETGSVDVDLDDGPTRVEVEGHTETITLRVTATRSGDPGSGITGLADITLPGIIPREVLSLPASGDPAPVEVMVLDSGLPGRDGCLGGEEGLRCLGGELIAPETTGSAAFRIPASTAGDWLVSGTLRTVRADTELFGSGQVVVSASSSRTTAPAGSPGSVVDGDSRTAWSPAFEDRQPRITLRFERETAIEQVHFATRGTRMQRARPLVRVEAGTEEITQRLPTDGRLVIPRTVSDTLTVTFLSVPGEDGPALAGMELVEVAVEDAGLAGVEQTVTAACGSGPTLTVNGTSVDTRAEASRTGWLGLDAVHWQACSAAALSGNDDVVAVSDWNGLAPARTTLVRNAAIFAASSAEPVAGTWSAGSAATVILSADPEDRVLSLLQNSSAGWSAILNGAELPTMRVDGHRQAFLVPAGASGAVQITYAPDRLYRVLLALGLVLAAALPMLAFTSRRGQPAVRAPVPTSGSHNQRWRHQPFWVVAGMVGFLVAGLVGGLVALGAAVAAGRMSTVHRAALPIGVLVVSALVAAIVAPSSVGAPWLEGAIRVAILIALAVAATPGQAGRKPRDRELDEAMAEEAKEQTDREADRQKRQDATAEE